MEKTDYPNIQVYRYHFHGFLASEEFKNVTAVVDSIKATVQPGHSEYELLLEAGRQRWREIFESKESKEVKN